MQNESKKHHFIPQSLLKYFSADSEGNKVYQFDKKNPKPFFYDKASLESIKNKAGMEHGFNTLEIENDIWNFEDLFRKVDGRLAILLKQIHQTRDVSALTKNDRRDWAEMVAVQMLRTPIMRTSMLQTATDFIDILVEKGLAKPKDFSVPSDNDSRHNIIKWFDKRDSIRTILENKDFVLFEGAGSTPFLISDNPVVIRHSTDPHGDTGLNSVGVGVYLPLGPDLVLAMLCKSIRINLNAHSIEALNMPQESAQMCIALREGLRTGHPVRWPDNFTAKLNTYQVADSLRFLYSSKDEFDVVRATLKAHPELRQVKSLMQVGPMGSLPPVSNRILEGQCLVLFGQNNHYMLSVLNWQNEQCEGETHDIDTLNRALADTPFSKMQYYDADTKLGRGRLNVRIEILSDFAPVRFRIRNVDPAMDAFDTAIAARQESSNPQKG